MKILIIGQAPPAVKQGVPYDTTQLYDWLKEVGVDKDAAQELFDFDAVYDKFPGFANGGHAIPTKEQMEDYWKRSLKEKVVNHQKIWIVGKVAYDFLSTKKEMKDKKIIKTIHPSKRNLDYYKRNKIEIINSISSLIFN